MHARFFAATSVVVFALGVAGTSAAASGQGKQPTQAPSPSPSQSQSAKAAPGSGTIVAAALTYLRIDKKTLLAKLKQGQSLAKIATSRGKSPQGLIDAAAAPVKVTLDARVAAGKLSAAEAAAILTQLRAQLATLVTSTVGQGTKAPSADLTPVLAYLQIDSPTLNQELKSGKSLAQIAAEHGKTADGVAAAILGPIRAKLDAQLTAGKLTASEHDALLARAQADVTNLVAGKS